MTYFKTLLLMLLGCVAGLCFYIFFMFDANYNLKLAQDAFLKGNYEQGIAKLDLIEEDVASVDKRLQRAYIAREQGDLELSNKLIQEALNIARNESELELIPELYVNYGLNAFLMENAQQMSLALNLIEDEQVLCNESLLLKILEGVKQERYKETVQLISGMKESYYLSECSKKAFETHIGKGFMLEKKAFCQLKMGNFNAARESLMAAQNLSLYQRKGDIAYLFGLSYLEEAKQHKLHEREPYYREAKEHFDQVPIHQERFSYERSEIIQAFQILTREHFQSEDYTALNFLMQSLEGWQANEELNYLAQEFIDTLDQGIKARNHLEAARLGRLLDHVLSDHSLRQQLQKRFEALVVHFLEEGNLDVLPHYWRLASLLSERPYQNADRIAQYLEEKIIQSMKNDTSAFQESQALLSFWDQVTRGSEQRARFVADLIRLSDELWLIEGEAVKALHIMVLAEQFTLLQDKASVRREISTVISARLLEEWQNNNESILPSLYLALCEFSSSQSHVSLEFPFHSWKKGESSEVKAELSNILKVDPLNKQAIQVAAQISYEEGLYAFTVALLSKGQHLDNLSKERLAMSELKLGLEEKGFLGLQYLDKNFALSDDAYRALTYEFLKHSDWVQALEVLKKLMQPTDEMLALSCLVNFRLDLFAEAYDDYRLLPPAYSQLHGFQSIAIESLISMSKLEQAEQIVLQILAKGQRVSTNQSPEFVLLEKREFADIDPYFIAGVFYKDYKNDAKQAVAYLEKEEVWRPEALLLKGQIYLSLGEYKKAEQSLFDFLHDSPDLYNKVIAMPYVASLYAQTNRSIEALTWYNNYFQSQPNDLSFKEDYLHLLMKLRRWDLALIEIDSLIEQQGNHTSLSVDRLSCLVHTGKWDEAKRYIKDLVIDPALSLQQYLLLTRYAHILHEKSIFDFAMKYFAGLREWTLSDAAAYLLLLKDTGDITDAHKRASVFEREVQENPDFAFTFASLNWDMSEEKKALDTVRLAAKKFPRHAALQDFLERNENDLVLLAAQEKESQQSASSFMQLKHKLHYTVERHAQGDYSTDEAYLKDLKGVYDQVLSLAHSHSEVPEFTFYLGRIAYLFGDDYQAMKYLLRTLHLDPSYTPVALYISLMYQEQGNLDLAMQILEASLSFTPYSPELLIELAGLYVQSEAWEKSLATLEEVLKYQPKNIEALIGIAHVYIQMKHYDDAVALLSEVLAMQPEHHKGLMLQALALYEQEAVLHRIGLEPDA